jgi:hypothetical protein
MNSRNCRRFLCRCSYGNLINICTSSHAQGLSRPTFSVTAFCSFAVASMQTWMSSSRQT